MALGFCRGDPGGRVGGWGCTSHQMPPLPSLQPCAALKGCLPSEKGRLILQSVPSRSDKLHPWSLIRVKGVPLSQQSSSVPLFAPSKKGQPALWSVPGHIDKWLLQPLLTMTRGSCVAPLAPLRSGKWPFKAHLVALRSSFFGHFLEWSEVAVKCCSPLCEGVGSLITRSMPHHSDKRLSLSSPSLNPAPRAFVLVSPLRSSTGFLFQ